MSNAPPERVTMMGRWIAEKLQQWLIFVLSAVLIVSSIAIGGWLQSSPTAPIEVAAAICDQTQPSPTPKATTAALAATPAPKATTTPAGQQAAAPAKADAKELPKTVA